MMCAKAPHPLPLLPTLTLDTTGGFFRKGKKESFGSELDRDPLLRTHINIP